MNKEFTRMQKLAGVITEGLYTTQMDQEAPIQSEGTPKKMKKSEFKAKIKEMIQGSGAVSHNLKEAKKKKKEEEEVDTVDVEAPEGDVDVAMDVPQPGDTSIDLDGDGTSDIDAGSSEAKKAFGDLTDAFQAAKALGDEKLIRQIANTITYFNKNIILNQG